jgi:hypothetical protein
MINFGGDGTYPGSNLTISGNTFINDRPGGSIPLLNETSDPDGGGNVPALITGNTFYNIDPGNFFVDYNAPPYDVASNNVFLFGAGPTLDTSPGYDVPEPASVVVLLFAVLSMATMRLGGQLIRRTNQILTSPGAECRP